MFCRGDYLRAGDIAGFERFKPRLRQQQCTDLALV